MIVVQQALFWFRDQAIASAADDAVRAQLRFFNLLTLPVPPAESRLIDLGPVTAVWWIAVIGLLAWKRRPGPDAQPAG